MTLAEPANLPPSPGVDPAQPGAAARRAPHATGLKVFGQNKLAVGGIALIVAIVAFCFLGPLFYHTDQVHTRLNQVTLPPGPGHPLGTDEVGYDVLGRLMAGGQTSLEVALAAAAIATLFGSLWGAVAGYVGGIVDAFMMRVIDVLLSIPTLFLLLLMASIFRPSKPVLMVVIALVSWLIPARLIRGETLTIKVREYVQTARAMGGSGPYNLFRHVLPNAVGTIAVNGTFQVADAILAIASMSYLGLGIPAPAADWGGMLSDGINYIYSGYWWLIYPPGLAIVLTVVAFNFVGDAVRDSFESRLRTVRD